MSWIWVIKWTVILTGIAYVAIGIVYLLTGLVIRFCEKKNDGLF